MIKILLLTIRMMTIANEFLSNWGYMSDLRACFRHDGRRLAIRGKDDDSTNSNSADPKMMESVLRCLGLWPNIHDLARQRRKPRWAREEEGK